MNKLGLGLFGIGFICVIIGIVFAVLRSKSSSSGTPTTTAPTTTNPMTTAPTTTAPTTTATPAPTTTRHGGGGNH